MWDDFNGTKLDESKWWDHNPGWQGRAPALFLPENVRLADGELQLTLRRDPVNMQTEIPPTAFPRSSLALGWLAESLLPSQGEEPGFEKSVIRWRGGGIMAR